MKVFYVAGPYRAPSEFEVQQNIDKAKYVAANLWEAGVAVVCPHLNTAHLGGIVADEFFLEGDLEILRRCDAVLFLKDWMLSKGACAEHSFALAQGIPVFYEGEVERDTTALLEFIEESEEGSQE